MSRLDTALVPFAKDRARLDLFLLGRSAMVLYFKLPLSTKDVDFVATRDSELETNAIKLSGHGSALALASGVYLDPVAPGLPPLPGWFRSRAVAVDGTWQVLRPWLLEVHDLAVTKLKSFRPKDREDLQLLCDRGLINISQLRTSLESAFPLWSRKPDDEEYDPDNPDWNRALAGFKKVEAYLSGASRSL